MLDVLDKIINIDGAIILGFLLLNLLIGIYFSKGITSLKEYCLGNRNFSTATIAYTIVATFIGGGDFNIGVYQTYKDGLYYMLPVLADPLAFLIIGIYYIPRMQVFLGKLSIAEAMGNTYGNVVRAFTAIIGVVLCLGAIAAQFIIMTLLITKIVNIPEIYAAVFSCLVVIIYTTLGGIKSITFTDVIQLFTFGVVLPFIALLIYHSLDEGAVVNMLTLNPQFSFDGLMNYKNPKLSDSLLLFIFYLIPTIDPALFQRLSMSRSVKQAAKAYMLAAIIYFIILRIIINFIGVLLLSDTSLIIGDFDNDIISYVLDKYFTYGLKGFLIVGIMAMAMSTADSYLNSGAILISHDLREALGIKVSEKKALLHVRITVLLLGIVSLYACTYFRSFFDLLIASYTFYIAIVMVPFTATVFGFRSTGISISLGMASAFIVIMICLYLSLWYGLLIAIFANLVVLISSHYLLRQPGGWEGIKDNETFLEINRKRKEAIHNFFSAIENFSIVTYLINSAKKQEANQVYLGFFCIISLFFNLYSLPKLIVDSNWTVINSIAYITLFLSTILISYPAWLTKFKNILFIALVTHLTIFIALTSSIILVALNSIGLLQAIILTTTTCITTILLRWDKTLLLIVISIASAILFCKYHSLNVNFNNLTIEFSIAYMIITTSLICFVYQKHTSDTLTFLEAKSSNLWQKVNDMDKEVRSANNIKAEFFSNINHEVRTPITGITSLGQALWDNYDNIPESKRRECTYTIAQNSERLISLMNNILDFSNLRSLKMPLRFKKTNITEIVYDSLKRCKKLYLEDKELCFKLDIEDDVYTKCDVHYIGHTIDNLIINAIFYSKEETTITITLKQKEDIIYFAIKDEGIGIPKEELEVIFNPFTTSSKTHSIAGGRGIGLALCYAAITAHKGRIWAESDGSNWSKFIFEI